jgi:hypothetical protein
MMRLTRDLVTKTFSVDGKVVHGVGRLIKAAGMETDYSTVPDHVLQAAAHRGIGVDLACDFLDDGDLDWDTVHPPWVPYVKAWETAKPKWGLKICRTQAWVYHPDYDYCGIIDVVALAHGMMVDIDRKTSKSLHPSPFGLQTAAYAMPGILIADKEGELFPRALPAERWIMHLTRGGPVRHQCADPDDFDDFRACIGVARGLATTAEHTRVAARRMRYGEP